MSRLLEAYRAVHEQGFLPIFVDDEYDSKMLVEACIAAGMKAIEYTLRRRDAHKMVPWIRENHPDLFLLVGSTLDDEKIVRKMKRRHPQLLTVAELDAMDVDGYISMLGWSPESIRKYSATRLIMPTAMTVNEALFQVAAGAHFAKLHGSDLGLVKRCRQSAAFDYCPILVTGGQTTEKIPETIDAGAILIATGFDLTIEGEPLDVAPEKVADAMKAHMDAVRVARARKWPELDAAIGGDPQTWLDALPHYHPF